MVSKPKRRPPFPQLPYKPENGLFQEWLQMFEKETRK
jgi:hypothetical protein